jgi:hypothetical protein
MMMAGVVGASCAIGVRSNACPQENPSSLRDELTQVLSSIERRHHSIATSYIVTSWAVTAAGTSGLDWRYDSSLPWLGRTRVRWLSCGPRLRIERAELDRANGGSGSSIMMMWDGETHAVVLPAERRCSLAAKPLADDLLGEFGLFNEWLAPAPGGSVPLSEVVRGARSVQRTDEGRNRRYVLDCGERQRRVLELVLRRDEAVHIQSLRMLSYGDRGTEEEEVLQIRLDYRVQEWEDYAGRVLPKVAWRETWSRSGSIHVGDGRSPIGALVKLERLDAANPSMGPPNETDFRPALEPGWTVIDHRVRLIYDIGARLVTMDGVEYLTEEAMDPGRATRYPELVVAPGPNAESERDDGPTPP